MTQDLLGRIAVVTGGGGGMGRVHALTLAARGADVAILDIALDAGIRNGEALTAATVVAEIEAQGRRAIGIELDLSQADVVAAAFGRIAAAFDRIDFLVNNAGGAITPIERSTATLSTVDDVETLLDANLRTTINCCRAAAPHLADGGAIVNVATVGVDLDDSTGRLAIYAAVKAAIVRYTRSLAVELGPRGIRANCVAPGLIETARVKAQAAARNLATAAQAQRIPLRRLGQSEDVAAVVAFLVGPGAAYVTGECIRVSGGMTLVS